MYYIPPITENPYIEEQIKTSLTKTSSNKNLSPEIKNSKKYKILTSIEICFSILYFLGKRVGNPR